MTFQFRKESIEEDLNSTFPSQGQGNPPLYYSLSDVVVPTYSINNVAEGSGLPENLQTAWDFSTGNITISNTTQTFITTPGFWQVDLNWSFENSTNATESKVEIDDGTSRARVWEINVSSATTAGPQAVIENKFIVFLRSGDSLRGSTNTSRATLDIWYRQIATLNGTLVNPLGYSAA